MVTYAMVTISQVPALIFMSAAIAGSISITPTKDGQESLLYISCAKGMMCDLTCKYFCT